LFIFVWYLFLEPLSGVGRFEQRNVQRAVGNVVNKKQKNFEKWRKEIIKKGGTDI